MTNQEAINKIIKSHCEGNLNCTDGCMYGSEYCEYRLAMMALEQMTDVDDVNKLKVLCGLDITTNEINIEENGSNQPTTFDHLHPKKAVMEIKSLLANNKSTGNYKGMISTNSPLVLNAIETYASKYEIADQISYYLDDRHVGNTELEIIYRTFSDVLQDLENERYSDY